MLEAEVVKFIRQEPRSTQACRSAPFARLLDPKKVEETLGHLRAEGTLGYRNGQWYLRDPRVYCLKPNKQKPVHPRQTAFGFE